MDYKRIVIKLSGEALGSSERGGLMEERLSHYMNEIREVAKMGVEVAVVIGGGNFWRGREAKDLNINPVEADYMGILATMMNSIALRDALERNKVATTLMSHLSMPAICRTYNRREAVEELAKKKVVLLGGGLGKPFFSTDTAAVTGAIALEADILLKGTKVDGVYAKDPILYPNSKRYDKLSLQEVYTRNLSVMDMTAAILADKHQLPIIVYNANRVGYLQRLLKGEQLGTYLMP